MARYLISEAARQTGVEAHALRFWEEELELEIPRNELGHRYYTEEHIAMFMHIKEMKGQGFQLKAIRENLNRTASAESEAARGVPAAETSDAEKNGTANGSDAGQEEAALADSRQDRPIVAADIAALSRQDRLVEFESIVYDIVTEALRNNNERLGREVSDRVNDKVVKEMNYLMRENDDHLEEHFRKLDETLMKKGRKAKVKGDQEAAATKVTKLPVVSQSKRKRKFFTRKRKTTMYG